MGVYDIPSPVPGVFSQPIGSGSVARFLQHSTSWGKHISDILEHGYSFLKYIVP